MKFLKVNLKIKFKNKNLKGTFRKKLDTKLAKKYGWVAKTNLSKGLSITISDYLEHNILKKKALSDIKYYLRKHNLIRVGTTAPENLLRKIYENSNLSGDIINHNEENLIHNFFTEN